MMIEHLINQRVLTTFKPIATELVLDAQKNYLFDLSYLSVLDVGGDKALDFLQGQLTSDLRLISESHMSQGAQCNLQGRILSLLDIISWQGIKIVMPQDLITATVNSLNKTAMLSRVTLNTNNQLQVFGFYLQNKEDLVPATLNLPETIYGVATNNQACCYHLGKGFYIVLVSNDSAAPMKDSFFAKNQLVGSLTWHSLRLAQQQIQIYPESRGLFLPHRLSLQQTPYLSFNKGCYKGQEIIARMHYKAKLKHQLKIHEIKTAQKLYSGQKLFDQSSQIEVGELIDFSILQEDHYLVAVSLLNEAGSLFLLEGATESIQFLDH